MTSTAEVAPGKGGKQQLELPEDKGNYYYQKAKVLYSKGQGYSIILEKVLLYLFKAIAYVPHEAKNYMFLAKVYLNSLDWTSAIYCLRYLLKLQPDNNIAKKRLAEVLVLKGQEILCQAILESKKRQSNGYELSLYIRAKLLFDEAFKHYKNMAHVWVLKAVCLVVEKQYTEALNCVKRAYACEQAKSLSHEVIILKAKLLWSLGLIDDGNKEIRQVINHLPDHPEVLAFMNRSFVKAEKLYKFSTKQFSETKYDEALRTLGFALNITSDDIKLYILQSKIYRMMDSLQDAFTSIQRASFIFKKASEFDIEIPEEISKQTNLILNEMALKFAIEGEYNKAIALFNKVIASEKTLSRGVTSIDYRFYMNRGDCYRAIGKLEHSVNDYLAALELAPSDWNIMTRVSLSYYLKAAGYFNVSDYVNAEIEITEALKFNPKVSEYYAIRGKTRYFLGRYDEAHSDFKISHEYNPNNEEVNSYLIQFDLNNTKKSDNSANSMATNIEGGNIRKMVVTPQTTIEALLNPRQVKELPTLKLLKYSVDNVNVKRNPIPYQQAKEYLPKLNPKMVIPLIAAEELSNQHKIVTQVMHSRYDVERSNNWAMLKQAKQSAQKLSVSKKKKNVDNNAKKQEMPMTSAALKRLSQSRTKHAIKTKTAIVAGVVTREDDPFVLTVTKKATNILVPSARSLIRRDLFNSADDGVVEHFDRENAEIIEREKELEARRLERESEIKFNEDLLARLTTPQLQDVDKADGQLKASKKGKYDNLTKKERKQLKKLKKLKKQQQQKQENENFADSESDSDGFRGSDSSGNDDDEDIEGMVYNESKLAELLRKAGADATMGLDLLLSDEINESSLLLSVEEEMAMVYKKIQEDNRNRADKIALNVAKGKVTKKAIVNDDDYDDGISSAEISKSSDSDAYSATDSENEEEEEDD
jgi:tetratricopeptide (TPR) repeat protein